MNSLSQNIILRNRKLPANSGLFSLLMVLFLLPNLQAQKKAKKIEIIGAKVLLFEEAPNGESAKKLIGEDYFLQEVIEFKCNYHGKLQDELNIDGKSSQRLSGLAAKNKCENLGFKVGTVEFRKCMEELTQ